MTMESDKRYFIEGLFVIGFSLAALLFFVWLANSGKRDDVRYRIHFLESVSGLAIGDAVKLRGVDVGVVRSMRIDPADPRLVDVEVDLRKEAPVKTDTKAVLKHKGLTGGLYIELDGGTPKTKTLVAATPAGQIPEIPSEKSSLSAVLEQLPKVIEKFATIETQTKKVLSDVGEVTTKVKENPSLLLRGPKEKRSTPDAHDQSRP
jgi:phospholipid/cholesterol/gamma-HCH transport system substrate-binding protein